MGREWYDHEEVSLVGVEPTRPVKGPWILSPMRLPFRHSDLGIPEDVAPSDH